jgi:hypothetical protein
MNNDEASFELGRSYPPTGAPSRAEVEALVAELAGEAGLESWGVTTRQGKIYVSLPKGSDHVVKAIQRQFGEGVAISTGVWFGYSPSKTSRMPQNGR